MKKILGLALFTGFAFASCNYEFGLKSKEVSGKLIYIKDTRTNLCFSLLKSKTHLGYVVTTQSCVPCDSAVLAQITEQEKIK